MTTAKTVVSEDYLQDLIASEKRLRAENEKIREQLRGEIESHQAMTKAYENEIKMLKESREIIRVRDELAAVTAERDKWKGRQEAYEAMLTELLTTAIRSGK